MKIKNTFLLIMIICILGPITLAGKDRIRVVSTLPDLADLVKAVGGDLVDAESLIKGSQDPHNVEALPSYMLKLRKADIFLIVGMDLDIWAYPIRDGSRNADLITVDCSKNIDRLQVPSSKIDKSQGDIHIYGNPHYWLDPENAKVIMANILNALGQVAPESYTVFEQNMAKYTEKLDDKIREWQQQMSPYRESKIIFFHNTWPYFTNRFGLNVIEFIEPKPGIPPSPAHTAKLLSIVKQQNIPVIAVEPYFDDRVPKLIARQSGASVITVAPSVGAVKEATNYIKLFDYNINTIVSTLKSSNAQ